MIPIIKQILNGTKQPDLSINMASDKHFESLLRDTELVKPLFQPTYQGSLKDISYIPPKAKLYIRWIDNAINEYLNQHITSSSNNLTSSLVKFRHHEFTTSIESYIAQFDQRIIHTGFAYEHIAGYHIDFTIQKEEKIATIIYYHAIVALTTAYFNWQEHFKQHLNDDKIIINPTDFFYRLLNHNLPPQIVIEPLSSPEETYTPLTFDQRIQRESTPVQVFYEKVNPKGFFAMPAITCLTDDSKILLISEITKPNNTPFAVAMLHHLKYYEHCQSQYEGYSKNNFYSHLAAALNHNVSDETIKKNFMSISNPADYLRDKYSAWLSLTEVKQFYTQLEKI